MKNLAFKVTILLFGLLLYSCGSAEQGFQYVDDVSGQDSGVPLWDGGEAPDWWNPGEGDLKEPGGYRYKIFLKHDTDVPLNLLVEENTTIMAEVFDFKADKPAVDYTVRFSVVNSDPLCEESSSCGRFMVQEGTTDSNGKVSIPFKAGSTGNVLYDVELSGKYAEPEGMQIQVNDLPTGTLKVFLEYDGPVAIHDINVRLMHGSVSCTQFNPINPWTDPLIDRQRTVSGPGASPVFDTLPIHHTYLVFATAVGPTGHLTAAGCSDAIHLLSDEEGVTEMTLKVHLLTLNPTGTYEADNFFDFTGAIPGQVGEIINLIVNIFYDPGSVLIDLVKELVSQYIGSWVTDIAFSLFEDALGDLITDWLLNNSPQFIQDLFQIGQDIVDIVKYLNLLSELKLSKLTSDYTIQGIQSWHGIVLHWTLGCPKEDDPDYDPACGAYPFSLQNLEDTSVPMDLIAGQFTAMVANFDDLIIDTHNVYLNYGKLILFVINELILPAVSSYHSLEDLLHSLIDCAAIADGFMGSILEAIGVSHSQVEGFCNSAENLIISPLEEIIDSLALDSKLRIHGKCQMIDDDDDLYVDRLEEGFWWGHVETQGDEGQEFEGWFTAEKVPMP